MNFKHQKLMLVDGRKVTLKNDGFWTQRLHTIETVTIPDVFNKFEKHHGGAFNNFKRVRDHKSGHHAGHSFYDGLVYECIRGASDFLGRNGNMELDKRLEVYIELIAAAQNTAGDGYINTYVTLLGIPFRWGKNGGNLLGSHELYNAGCLVEAGIHHFRATGKVNLLTVAILLANHITQVMGPIPCINIVPAHSLPEEAFLKLYRMFTEQPDIKDKLNVPVHEEAYLNLVKFWLDMRGHHQNRENYPRYMGEYSVDHMPLVEQSEAVGHAVRAALLYCGMTEYINITGDKAYEAAVERIWENIISRKMHISGGIGAVHNEEKFGYEYQLPNTAYLETCASVALLFFARAMFVHSGSSRYVDVMERALYNGILSGVSLQGNTYFYRNPLMSIGDEERWEWHSCPCCPPMLLKAMGELPSYLYAANEKDVYINLYAASSAEIPVAGGTLELSQETNFPWEGNVHLEINHCPPDDFRLLLRIPVYAENVLVSINGTKIIDPNINDGYMQLDGVWTKGDKIDITFGITPTFIAAHPYVSANAGQVALQYGPLIYCLEEADNDMNDVEIPEHCVITPRESPSLPGITELCFEDTLYRNVTAIPYYAWANRSKGRMQVWTKKEGFRTAPAETWSHALYKPYNS